LTRKEGRQLFNSFRPYPIQKDLVRLELIFSPPMKPNLSSMSRSAVGLSLSIFGFRIETTRLKS